MLHRGAEQRPDKRPQLLGVAPRQWRHHGLQDPQAHGQRVGAWEGQLQGAHLVQHNLENRTSREEKRLKQLRGIWNSMGFDGFHAFSMDFIGLLW